MDIRIGDIVFVRHYSGQAPIRSIIRGIQDNNLSLKLTTDFASFNLFEGDPVVIGFENDGNVYITSCILTQINLKQRIINMEIGKIEQMSDMRRYERFPVSLYAEVRSKGNRVNSVSVVKNISLIGMMFCSKTDFLIDQELEFDINIGNKLVFLNSTVIWKINKQNSFEYGVEINYKTQKTQEQVKQYLQKLSEEHNAFIKQLKEFI